MRRLTPRCQAVIPVVADRSPYPCIVSLDSSFYSFCKNILPLSTLPLIMASKSPQPAVNSKNLQSSFDTLIDNYTSTTPARVKLIDAFLLFILLSGILQFAYRILVTVYPFHAFAGG